MTSLGPGLCLSCSELNNSGVKGLLEPKDWCSIFTGKHGGSEGNGLQGSGGTFTSASGLTGIKDGSNGGILEGFLGVETSRVGR